MMTYVSLFFITRIRENLQFCCDKNQPGFHFECKIYDRVKQDVQTQMPKVNMGLNVQICAVPIEKASVIYWKALKPTFMSMFVFLVNFVLCNCYLTDSA